MSKAKNPPEKDEMICSEVTRRDFISKVGSVTAGLAIAGCSTSKTPFSPNDPNAAAKKPSPEPTPPLPNGTMAKAKVATAQADSYDETNLRKQIESMFDALGGLDDVIKSGDTVGIKINMTGGVNSFWKNNVPPYELYLTHPAIVKVVGEIAKDAGASNVYVLEAVYEWESFTYEDPASGLSHDGVAKYLGGKCIDLNYPKPYDDYVIRPVKGGGLIYQELTQCGILNDLDCFISLPKAKLHLTFAGLTLAMKNLVGTLPVPPGIYNKGAGHRKGIHEHPNGNDDLCRVILDLNKATPINLTVIDAIQTTIKGEGPWNQGRNQLTQAVFNTLIAGKHDIVAADSVGSQVIGFDPMAADYTGPWKYGSKKTINYFKLAEELGMGTNNLENIEVVDATASTYVPHLP